MLYRKTITRPIPTGAEIVAGHARVVDPRTGKARLFARLTADGKHILVKSQTWTLRIRGADGIVRDISTGCRDRGAARAKANAIIGEQEKIRAGILDQRDLDTAAHGRRPLADVIGEFRRDLANRGRTEKHVKETCRYLERAAAGMAWKSLADMDGDRLVSWLAAEDFGARMWNHFVVAHKTLARWCVRRGLLFGDPFRGVERRNERADRRHVRRALTADELTRLVAAARSRVTRGRWFIGETRAVAYQVLAMTGLRWSELRSIRLGDVYLDAAPPHIILEARNAKNRTGATVPLQRDVAAALAGYIGERRSSIVGHPGRPVGDDDVLFPLPVDGTPAFHADCAAAGIPRRDRAGRVADVHCLRHTFGTMLARAGVPLQTAQRAMRHATVAMTANIYTHLGVLDVAGAVEKLPHIGEKQDALNVAPLGVNSSHFDAQNVQIAVNGGDSSNVGDVRI